MMNSPFLRQILVASSPQFAAISIGGVVGFPNVILEQFKANDSSIHVDLDMATWIGSTHGLAGIPSIAMPTIMQWRGRKLSFFICCLLIIIGWILTYISKNVETIIIAECFHGLASHSLITVSFYAISEMVDPKYRMISMSFYLINQILGMGLTGILGRYLHWKNVSIVMSTPVLLALLIGCIWPESPSWLAYKGEYSKCEKAFTWLRGSDESSRKELKELLNAHRDSVKTRGLVNTKYTIRSLWLQITSRDFFIPCFHTFVNLCSFYWSGFLVVVIYGTDMIRTATNNASAVHYGAIAINVIMYVGTLTSSLLLKKFNNKTVFLASGFSSSGFMFAAFVVTLLQSVGVVSSNSLLCAYFLVAFMLTMALGIATAPFTVSAELMPVKHRGLGGAVYVILICILHSSSLKISPYLMLYMGLWGTLLLFAVNCFACMLFIWRCVPETKGRTLQEIEDYYNLGSFVTRQQNVEVAGQLL